MHQRPNGTWELKFKVPQNGKNVWKSVYGKTQEECLEKKKAVEERALQGLKVVDQHTFETGGLRRRNAPSRSRSISPMHQRSNAWSHSTR